MKNFVLIMCLSLTGCFYQSADQFDIQRAKNVCGGIEKIVEIEVYFSGREYVQCISGVNKTLDGVSVE